MERAVILTGKTRGVESYQLMVDCSYISASYDGSSQRETFYEEISTAFVKRILEEAPPLELGVFNGLRINPETEHGERIPKLEEQLVAQFSESVCSKLSQAHIGTMPDSSRN